MHLDVGDIQNIYKYVNVFQKKSQFNWSIKSSIKIFCFFLFVVAKAEHSKQLMSVAPNSD